MLNTSSEPEAAQEPAGPSDGARATSRHRVAINVGFVVAILLLVGSGWITYRANIEAVTSAR